MAGQLEGKVAFITGAARGQGRSHALTLAREGADIIAVDICAPSGLDTVTFSTPEDLEETARQVSTLGRRVHTAHVDVRDKSALKAAVDAGVSEFGHLDIVLANAGISTINTWDEVSEEIWNASIDINLTGVWNTLVAGTPHLIEAGGGVMVATSSTLGIVGRPFFAPYAASKHGVVGIMKSMANELAKYNIRVNTVHPTGVDTPMLQGLGGMQGLFEKEPGMAPLFENALKTPNGLVEAQDISNAILFLVADTGRYITGLQLTVDAGLTIR
jgi:SDR family mycofactocin-dependent oxidoreductase